MFHGHYLGLYEKALDSGMSWKDKLMTAKDLGFDYMEISIDESDDRIARLYWDRRQKKELLETVLDSGIQIRSMCLSAHRRFPFGSNDAGTRDKAHEIMEKAIEFADFMNIKVIQLAGYDVYYEPGTEDSRRRFEEGMKWSAEKAAQHQVMLGMEIMDTPFMNSITKHLGYEERIGSPYYRVYPDIGNLTAWGNPIEKELRAGIRSVVAFHLKETLPVTESFPGQFRNVPFGQGTVDFKGFFRLTKELGYTGPFLVEMWSGTTDNDIEEIRRTIKYLDDAYYG